MSPAAATPVAAASAAAGSIEVTMGNQKFATFKHDATIAKLSSHIQQYIGVGVSPDQAILFVKTAGSADAPAKVDTSNPLALLKDCGFAAPVCDVEVPLAVL